MGICLGGLAMGIWFFGTTHGCLFWGASHGYLFFSGTTHGICFVGLAMGIAILGVVRGAAPRTTPKTAMGVVVLGFRWSAGLLCTRTTSPIAVLGVVWVGSGDLRTAVP